MALLLYQERNIKPIITRRGGKWTEDRNCLGVKLRREEKRRRKRKVVKRKGRDQSGAAGGGRVYVIHRKANYERVYIGGRGTTTKLLGLY